MRRIKVVFAAVISLVLITSCGNDVKIPTIDMDVNTFVEVFNMGVESTSNMSSSLIDTSKVEETDITSGEFSGIKKISYTNKENIAFDFYAKNKEALASKIDIIYDGNVETKEQLAYFYSYVYVSIYMMENYDKLINNEEPNTDLVDEIYYELEETSDEYIEGEKAKYAISWGEGSQEFVLTFSILPIS